METIVNLKDLMLDQLIILHNAEEHMGQVVSETVNKVTSQELRSLLKYQQEIQKNQLATLEEILVKSPEFPTVRSKNTVVQVIVAELDNFIERCADSEILESGVIMYFQQIIHFKIACYGTLSTYAWVLNLQSQSCALHQILNQEKEMDRRLSEMALNCINMKAKNPLIII